MEVPEESFHWSSWDSRTCYPRRAFIQGLSDDKSDRRALTSDYKRFPLPSSSHRIFIFNLQSLIDDPVCDLRSKKWKRLIVCLLFSFVFLSSYTSSLTFGDQSRVMIIELSGLVRRCVKMKKKQPPEGNT